MKSANDLELLLVGPLAVRKSGTELDQCSVWCSIVVGCKELSRAPLQEGRVGSLGRITYRGRRGRRCSGSEGRYTS